MFPELNYIQAALLLLPASAQLRIANLIRPATSYLWAQFLPEMGKPTYEASTAFMTVNAVMAGLAGLSSNYPPGGFITASTRNEKVAKIANHVELQENDLRTLQGMVQNAILSGATAAVTVEYIVNELLNFFDKMVLQPHLDTMEYLRGQALTNGRIDWWNHGIHLEVDYLIPSTQVHAQRTGNDAYGGTTSKFWEDVRFHQSALLYSMQAMVMHPRTFDVIAGNPVNGIEIINMTDERVRIRRIIETTGGNDRISSDTRDSIEILLYGLEATKVDDSNPLQTVNVPFILPGKVTSIGRPPANQFAIGRTAVGQGSTPNPQRFIPLGYTHIAPTIEGGGQIGRWGRTYTPQERPWAVVGQGVTNGLPVIENVLSVANTSTEMP